MCLLLSGSLAVRSGASNHHSFTGFSSWNEQYMFFVRFDVCLEWHVEIDKLLWSYSDQKQISHCVTCILHLTWMLIWPIHCSCRCQLMVSRLVPLGADLTCLPLPGFIASPSRHPDVPTQEAKYRPGRLIRPVFY